MTALACAPAGVSLNSHAFLPTTKGRILFSQGLLSIGRSARSVYRVSMGHKFFMYVKAVPRALLGVTSSTVLTIQACISGVLARFGSGAPHGVPQARHHSRYTCLDGQNRGT